MKLSAGERRRRGYMEKESRKLTVYGKTKQFNQTVPQIRFEGQWLEALGFLAGDKIQLDCEDNKITITKLQDGNG